MPRPMHTPPDLDTEKAARWGQYRLAGRTYSKLLDRLASDHFKNASPELRNEILVFYGGHSAPDAGEHLEARERRLRELDQWRP